VRIKAANFVFIIVCALACAGSSANAQGVSKCFRADWLQGERVINFRVNGGKVAGTFVVGGGGGGEDIPPDATYEFSGTLRGDTLTVKFDGGKLPDVSPSEMKSLVWTLVKSGGAESLRIKFRGRNYETNKYEDSFADFEACGGGYADLAKKAERVRFARGASSASFPLTFKAKGERRSFLLNMKAGQRLAVEARGCAISFYYPDRREGEEPSIDEFSPDRLKQSGDYLFVISPAPSPGRYSVKFTVTN
jgi:head-tail adaptor